MDDQLLTQLRGFNPWWQAGRDGMLRYNDPEYKRELYSDVSERFSSGNQIVSIVGMRQTGKSTMIRQVIRDLLSQGVDPTQILYVSFDDPVLRTQYRQDLLLKQVIDTFTQGIRNEKIEDTSTALYFFFDEIHQLPHWEQWLKSYYDRAFPARYMVSGSASLHLQQKNAESLLGRIYEYTLYPFSFREYIEYTALERRGDEQLAALANDARQHFNAFITDYRIGEQKAERLKETYTQANVWHKQTIIDHLRNFLVVGGFPRVWQQDDLASQQRMLWEQHISKVIFQDLPQVARIRKEQELEFLFVRLAGYNAREIALAELREDLGVHWNTLNRYLYYLIRTFLLYRIDKTKSKREIPKRRAGNVKFYMSDVAFVNALLKNSPGVYDDPQEMSYIAENLVCTAMQHWNTGVRRDDQVSFYRDQSGEVDFVFKHAGSIMPVEVKWRNEIPQVKGLDKLCRDWDLDESIVVTKDGDLQYENGRLYIPLWFFLLVF